MVSGGPEDVGEGLLVPGKHAALRWAPQPSPTADTARRRRLKPVRELRE